MFPCSLCWIDKQKTFNWEIYATWLIWSWAGTPLSGYWLAWHFMFIYWEINKLILFIQLEEWEPLDKDQLRKDLQVDNNDIWTFLTLHLCKLRYILWLHLGHVKWNKIMCIALPQSLHRGLKGKWPVAEIYLYLSKFYRLKWHIVDLDKDVTRKKTDKC